MDRVAHSEESADLAQAKAAFLLTMRARGIQDVNVLRAFETVPREIFVPHRYQDLARRHLALPLRCGQTLPEPWLTARMLEALALSSRQRVLEIGAGSGYATALIARIAREVVSFERFQSLAVEAAARLARLGVDRAKVIFGDGLGAAQEIQPVDRIIVQGALNEPPDSLVNLLDGDGVMVMARPYRGDLRRQHVVRIARVGQGGLDIAPICSCRLQPILKGAARAL